MTLLSVPLCVINVLKGKTGFAMAGLLCGGLLWLVGAIRIAKPDSWWAQRFYADNPEKLRESNERFDEDARYAARIVERRYRDELGD